MFRIGIVDTDSVFISRLKEVLEQVNPGCFEIMYFPDINKARTAAEKTNLTALLVNKADEAELKTIPRQCKVALLTENRAALKVLSVPAVCKYQSIDEWQSFLTELCKRDDCAVNGGGHEGPTPSGKICLFSSTGGGVGASAAAAAFCVCCASRGVPVVYLNFETFPCTERYFAKACESCDSDGPSGSCKTSGSCEYGFEDVMYALRSKKYELAPALQKALVEDSCGVAFIQPPSVAVDMFSVTGEEIVKICDEIRNLNKYKVIVIDMDFESTENMVLPFIVSDRTVLVTDGSTNANHKLLKMMESLPIVADLRRDEVLNKILYLYNRFELGTSEVIEDAKTGKLGGINRLNVSDDRQLIREIAELFPMKKLLSDLGVEYERDV